MSAKEREAPAAEKVSLWLVSSPIGHLGDVSARALKVIDEADVIACENVDFSRKLFSHARIDLTGKKITRYSARSSLSQERGLIGAMKSGAVVALLSDSGSPTISDPGYSLLRMALAHRLRVSAAPGPSAFLMAVALSGFPTSRFIFEGFLPRKKGRGALIDSWRGEKRSIVFYESPTRLIKTLDAIEKALGPDRHVAVAREMTRAHEEFVRGAISEVLKTLSARGEIRGAVSVVIAPSRFKPVASSEPDI